MRHPRIDLRTVFGPHIADGTRAIMIEHQGDILERMRPSSEREGRAYARSPAALARRRQEKSQTSYRGRRTVPGAQR